MKHILLVLLVLMVCLPVAAQDQPPAQCAVLVGLIWPDHDLSHAQVRLFRDKERRDLVGAFPARDAEGKVVLAAAPGTYYLTVVVDSNGDDKLNAGDGLGFYGVEDPNKQQPQPLELKEAATGFWLPITLVMGADGKLTPTGVKVPAAAARPEPRRMTGTVLGGTGALTVVYLVPASGRGECHVALPATDGSFGLSFVPGEYYVFALHDLNQTEGADPGDLFAVQGYAPEKGQTFPTVSLTGDVNDLQVRLEWRISETGLLKHLETQADGPQVALPTLPAVVVGHTEGITGTGIARAGMDAGFGAAVLSAPVVDGRFVLALPAGVYYLTAMSTAEAGGKPAPGDRVAFYGVSDLRKAHGPQPLALKPGEIATVTLRAVARLDEQRRPVPLQ